MSEIKEVNVRNRLLCCSNLNELSKYEKNYSGLESSKFNKNNFNFCDEINNVFNCEETVRGKIQASYVARRAGCDIGNYGKQEIFGAVIEFGTISGVDALAVYSDGHAAWYDSNEKRLVECELRNNGIIAKNNLFEVVKVAFGVARYVDELMPDPPSPGMILVSKISTVGVVFCLGASRDVASDKLSGPIIHHALGIRKMILK